MKSQAMLFSVNTEPFLMRGTGESTLVGKLQAKLDRKNVEMVKAQRQLADMQQQLANAQRKHEQQRNTIAELSAAVQKWQNMRYSTTHSIPAEMWRRLVQLCHPDRHGGSEASNKATQWLNSIRP